MIPQPVASEEAPAPIKPNSKKRKWLMVAAIVLAVLLLLALFLAFFTRCPWGLFVPQNPHSVTTPPPLPEALGYEQDGVRYVYNPDVVSILLLGVQMQDGNQSLAIGPQADTILLLTINTKTGKTDLLPIPRDIFTPLIYPDIQGGTAFLEDGFLCNAYALGGQFEEKQGGQLTQAAMSYLCNEIPMNRFLAMDMAAIRTMVDAVGGVPVELTGDFSVIVNKQPGELYTLDGEQAELYLRLRAMLQMDGSNISRMVRQREFFFALIHELKQEVKGNWLFPFQLYQMLLPHMTTDMSLREMAYIGTSVLLAGQPELHVFEGEMVGDVYRQDADFLQKYLRERYYMPA